MTQTLAGAHLSNEQRRKAISVAGRWARLARNVQEATANSAYLEEDVLNHVVYPALHDLNTLAAGLPTHIDALFYTKQADVLAVTYVTAATMLVRDVCAAEKRGMSPALQLLEVVLPAFEDLKSQLKLVRKE